MLLKTLLISSCIAFAVAAPTKREADPNLSVDLGIKREADPGLNVDLSIKREAEAEALQNGELHDILMIREAQADDTRAAQDEKSTFSTSRNDRDGLFKRAPQTDVVKGVETLSNQVLSINNL